MEENGLISTFRSYVERELRKERDERDIFIVFTTGGRFEGQFGCSYGGPEYDYFEMIVRVTYTDHKPAPVNQPSQTTDYQLVKIDYSAVVGFIRVTEEEISRYVQ